MELLKAAVEANPGTIVIVMTGNPSVASNVEALRAGAWDYIPSRSARPTSRSWSPGHARVMWRASRASTRSLIPILPPNGRRRWACRPPSCGP